MHLGVPYVELRWLKTVGLVSHASRNAKGVAMSEAL